MGFRAISLRAPRGRGSRADAGFCGRRLFALGALPPRPPRSRSPSHPARDGGHHGEDRGDRARDEPHAEEQGDGDASRLAQGEAREASPRPDRAERELRPQGRGFRRHEDGRLPRRPRGVPLRGQVHAPEQAHGHLLGGGGVRVHDADVHPRRDSLPRGEDPAVGPPRDHRGREGREGARASGHLHRAHVQRHRHHPRRAEAADAQEAHRARALRDGHPPEQGAAEDHVQQKGEGRDRVRAEQQRRDDVLGRGDGEVHPGGVQDPPRGM